MLSLLFSTLLIISSILSSSWFLLQVYYYKSVKEILYKYQSLNRSPKISIIVAIKNEPIDIIEELFENLSSLDYENYEVIVISDDDEDYFRRILLEVKGNKIHLFRRDERKGRKAGALNFGISKASGEYLVFLDAEARVDRYFLSKIAVMLKDREAIALKLSVRNLNSPLGMAYAKTTDFSMKSMFLSRWEKGLFIFPNGSALAIKRDAMKKLMWREGLMTEDLDLGIRCVMHGIKIDYIHDIEVSTLSPLGIFDLYEQIKRWAYGSGELLFSSLRLAKFGLKGIEGIIYVNQWGIYSFFLFMLILTSTIDPIVKIPDLILLVTIILYSISIGIYSLILKAKGDFRTATATIWGSFFGYIQGLIRIKSDWKVTPKDKRKDVKPFLLYIFQYLLILFSFIDIYLGSLLQGIMLFLLSISIFIME
ncbi:glycosyl transferase family 2 [Candidatus Acidianus copahuensis]|uniref:Glycosyl transferase family 2 n=1 Tax=Candidatus Acidianus copahuensis TaxID=1160895 RepID=A0A031LTH1_9CREN|nr:glycosyl transferase family 2 [Candidatus Acidianus copahuensis]